MFRALKQQFYILYRLSRKVEGKALLLYHAKRMSLQKPQKTRIVFCCNGAIIHGGLVDRLNGIITFYDVAQQLDAEFYIQYTHPIALSQYWAPNQVKWENNSIRFNPFRDRILLKISHKVPKKENPVQWIDTSKPRTYFVYANANLLMAMHNLPTREDLFDLWQKHFNALFAPTEKLTQALNALPTGDYRVCHLRFLGILGEFNEANRRHLTEPEVTELLARIDTKIDELLVTYPDMPLYVLSDSPRFLAHIEKHPGVLVLPGKPKHIDLESRENSDEENLKTFTDFHFMGRSKRLFALVMPPLYGSGFARVAALQHNVPYMAITE